MHIKRFCADSRATVVYAAAQKRKPRLTGYAAVFYRGAPEQEFRIAPQLVERISAGAFDRALREDDVRALFNHDANLILGRKSAGTLRLSVDERGLKYEIDAGTKLGRQVVESVERGDITGASFGFEVEDEQFAGREPIVRTIRSVKLYDVGPVTFPAYSATEAEVRSLSALAMRPVVAARCDEIQGMIDEQNRRLQALKG